MASAVGARAPLVTPSRSRGQPGVVTAAPCTASRSRRRCATATNRATATTAASSQALLGTLTSDKTTAAVPCQRRPASIAPATGRTRARGGGSPYRRRRPVACTAADDDSSSAGSSILPSLASLRGQQQAAPASATSMPSEADSRKIVLLCAVAMLLASADRTIFSLASLAIAEDLGLGMSTLGLLQSAFLWWDARLPWMSCASSVCVPRRVT